METKETKNLHKGISCNTYLDIEKYLLLSSVGLNIFSSVLKTALPISNAARVSLSGIASLTGLAYLTMVWSDGIEHTEEIKKIKKSYQEIIKNYNKLNKEFNLNDPVQIFTMFNYLIYRGYLSDKKCFEFSDSRAKDIKAIRGANVITGKGVCRHIAAMFTDILEDYNIETNSLAVYIGDAIININPLEKQKYTKEELIKQLQSYNLDNDTEKTVMKIIEDLDAKNNLRIEFQYLTKAEKNIIKRTLGNHAITYAYKDGKSYFLDPTNKRIYRREGKVLTDTYLVVSPKLITSFLYNRNSNTPMTIKRITKNYPSIDIEEQNKMITETKNICKNNIDIFEQFYKDNKDLYSETSNTIMSLKNEYNPFKRK